MSAITLSFPLDSMPGLPVEEGSEFVVKVRDGKLQVTLTDPEEVNNAQKAAEVSEDPAERFVRKWSGAFRIPDQEELNADPRLAYLIQKHVK
jgi:hypothetical protein